MVRQIWHQPKTQRLHNVINYVTCIVGYFKLSVNKFSLFSAVQPFEGEDVTNIQTNTYINFRLHKFSHHFFLFHSTYSLFYTCL